MTEILVKTERVSPRTGGKSEAFVRGFQMG